MHSINCIYWFGSEFAKINKTKDPRTQEEEHYLSVVYPTETKQYNIIYGEILCVHYGFGPQRKVLDTTDVLDRYDLVSSNLKKYKYIN
jgi:hypothetical protein